MRMEPEYLENQLDVTEKAMIFMDKTIEEETGSSQNVNISDNNS